jgi:hypothetical protein
MTGLVSGWQMMVVTPPAAAACVADAKVSHSAAAFDDLSALGDAGRADAAFGLANDAVREQKIADEIDVAGRINDPRVGKKDGAAVAAVEHHCFGPVTLSLRLLPKLLNTALQNQISMAKKISAKPNTVSITIMEVDRSPATIAMPASRRKQIATK